MSMIRRMHLIMLGCLLSFNAFCSSDIPVLMISNSDYLNNRWSVLASIGYTEFQKTHGSGGQTALGRFALGAELLATSQTNFGLELGVQTGNRMKLEIPHGALSVFGNIARTTMRPMLDLLITAHANPVNESLLFTQIKGGLAYRHWQMDSVFFNNKSEFSGEFQAGFGYPITEISNLNLLYQGIFGGNPKLRIRPYSFAGYIANLPIQHGLLLGFSIIA